MYSDLLLDRNATVYKVQIYIFAPAPELIMGVCSLAALGLRLTLIGSLKIPRENVLDPVQLCPICRVCKKMCYFDK